MPGRSTRRPCPHADELPGGRYVCDACQAKRKTAQQRKHYKRNRERILARTATYYEAHREDIKAYQRDYYWARREQVNAERRERYQRNREAVLERKRAEREAVRADPVRRAASNEYFRMYRRLVAEREGRPMRPVPEERYPAASSQWTMPAEQVRELVREYLRAGHTEQELAHASGVPDRSIRRVLAGDGRVSVGIADRLVVALGLHLDLITEGVN